MPKTSNSKYMTIKSIKDLDPKKSKSLGRVGLKMFFRLVQLWGLDENEQLNLLGLSSCTTLANWKSKAISNEDILLPPEALERLSLIAGIQKSLELLFPKDHCVSYVRARNTSFNGDSILDVMLTGGIEELYRIRRYLDTLRQTHYL